MALDSQDRKDDTMDSEEEVQVTCSRESSPAGSPPPRSPHSRSPQRDSRDSPAPYQELAFPGLPQPLRLTNFFIEDILRPDFGRKESYKRLDNRIERLERDSKDRTERLLDPRLDSRYTPLLGHFGLSVPLLHQAYFPHSSPGKSDDGYPPSSPSRSSSCPSPAPSSPCSSTPVKSPPADTPTTTDANGRQILWPAWVYCTRYSDRPSSGRRAKCKIFYSSSGTAYCSWG